MNYLTKFVEMTEEEKEMKECSDFVQSKLNSFEYLKKTEHYFEGYYEIAYLFDYSIVVSVTMRYEEMQNDKQLCSIGVFQKKDCILLDYATLENINKYLKNVQDRFETINKQKEDND